MSYLEWNIESIWYLAFFVCGLWFYGSFFFSFLLLWTHQQRLKGIFPFLLSENAVNLCVLMFLAPNRHILRSRIKPVFGSTDFQARRGRGWRLGWGPWRAWREAWCQAESGWFSGLRSLRRGEHTVPRSGETLSGEWLQGCCQGQSPAPQLGNCYHAIWSDEERVQLQCLPTVGRPVPTWARSIFSDD